MLDVILKFAAYSRKAGLRISTAEVLDCSQQIEYIDVGDESQFKDLLRTNFAKSKREQTKFDHIYPLFFHKLRNNTCLPRINASSTDMEKMSSPHLMTRQQDAGVMLQGDTEDLIDAFATPWFHDQHREDLGEKSFFSFTQKEMEEMQEVIELLVRKLKDTIKRRHAKTKRGIPDIKKILRTASRYQGIPMQLFFRGKPKQRGKIVTLCDVSGSVWTAAKFMLSMLYSLQDCFLAVRSFIFVSELAEVTRTFERYEVKKAIDKALVEAKIDYKGTTNYGKTFRYFKTQYLDILNKKTTLIIIGDSRTNYTNPEEEILKEMQDKCQRVIWLNPEPRVLWNTGDSQMRTYETYCRQVRHCENLNQLLTFIKHLVL